MIQFQFFSKIWNQKSKDSSILQAKNSLLVEPLKHVFNNVIISSIYALVVVSAVIVNFLNTFYKNDDKTNAAIRLYTERMIKSETKWKR